MEGTRAGVSNSFPPGPHQPRSCLQRAKIILGLHTCNYSLTVQELKLYVRTFEGNCEADVAPVEMSVTPLDSRCMIGMYV